MRPKYSLLVAQGAVCLCPPVSLHRSRTKVEECKDVGVDLWGRGTLPVLVAVASVETSSSDTRDSR